ncbi:MAG: helix-turn-helix transcriptional regulator [Peptococcaceae bacterium]|nr:helix-turn-helix transcriptional regulator [Peptococcaceae bacterium]
MGEGDGGKRNLSERNLSVLVFSLFFSWTLAFPFEGQILYSLASAFDLAPDQMVFGAIGMHFTGLLLCGFFIRTMRAAKFLLQGSIIFCILASGMFFFPPSLLWSAAILSSSILSGGCVAAWGYFLKSGTPKNERIKTVADGLIYSNILMIAINMTALHLSPYLGLGLSMLLLGVAFMFALRLPPDDRMSSFTSPEQEGSSESIAKPLAFLCLFIVVITINSGLMYHVLSPAYAHHEWLTSWYWAIPYIIALGIMRNLPRKTNRTYVLYVAIAMIGFSFIAFMSLDRSAASYLVVNTLMLGACGVYDLFWWSILGEMMSLDKNPAKVLGAGLAANVLGVLLGGLIGSAMTSASMQTPNSTLLALAVVCVTLVMLPPLNEHLTRLLKHHVFLTAISGLLPEWQNKVIDNLAVLGQLTERESEIAALLLKGKTYRMIAGELHISENTVKTHIKNIYSKYKVQSRTELVNVMLEQQSNVRL